MDFSSNLELPYILPAQAQKHVTHNEAIDQLDALVHLAVQNQLLTEPPADAEDGDRFIVADQASGEWAGKTGQVAVLQHGAWVFLSPKQGWVVYDVGQQAQFVYAGGVWEPLQASANGTDQFGVNTTADETNRLAVKSDAVLISHDDVTPGSGDIRVVVNKSTVSSVGSLLFQTSFSGRAEVGLTGDDRLRFRVSADNITWTDAMIIDPEKGRVSYAAGAQHGFTHDETASGININPAPNDPSSLNDGDIWYNATVGKFRKRENGVTSNLDTAVAGSAGSGGTIELGGNDQTVQFNNGGVLEGSDDFKFNNATGDVQIGKFLSLPVSANASTGVIRQNNRSLLHSFGSGNLFLGENSGNFTTTGFSNVGFGPNVMTSLTSGFQNLAFGLQAGRNITTGQRNTIFGTLGMFADRAGSFNVAIGSTAMQKGTSNFRNVAIGFSALFDATSMVDSVAVGYHAGRTVSTGDSNVFVGPSSGIGITTGSGNVVLGRQENLPTDLSETIIIATGTGQRRLAIDDTGKAEFEGVIKSKIYQVATLPPATSAELGAMAFVDDEIGGPVPVFSDGTNWLRSTDRQIASSS